MRQGLDAEDFEGVLTRLRPLISQDSIQVHRVWNILEARLDGDHYRQLARDLRARLAAAMRDGGIGYFVDDERVEPSVLLDLVMNGVIFHDDPEKAARLAKFSGTTPSLVAHQVEVLVLESVLIVEDTARLIRVAGDVGALPWRLNL